MEPDVLQMLEIGCDCGLNHLEEAYNNYMLHYDCFFSLADYALQKKQFDKEIIQYGLTEVENGSIFFKDITIEEAIALVKG